MGARHQFAARRKAMGHSQESLARELRVAAGSVARWEQGTSRPKATIRGRLAELLELSPNELERLLDLGEGEGLGSNGHAVPTWLGVYASMEQSAAALQTFEPLVVPALLQTDAYAKAVELAYHLPVTDEEANRRAEIRIARQAILHREREPLLLSCVIDEAVIRRVTGTREVMASQLGHLQEMAGRPNIEIRIVPLDSSPYGAAFGAFQLLTAPGSAAPYLACSEDLAGMQYHDNQMVVDSHAELYSHLLGRSMNIDNSQRLIDEMKESYER